MHNLRLFLVLVLSPSSGVYYLSLNRRYCLDHGQCTICTDPQPNFIPNSACVSVAVR